MRSNVTNLIILINDKLNLIKKNIYYYYMDESDADDIKITDEAKAIIDMNSRIRDVLEMF